MQHPVLKNIRSLFVYITVWLILSVLDFVFIQSSYHFSIIDNIIGSLTFNVLFALFGVAIWYVVQYSYPDKIGSYNLLINHISTAVVIVIIWIASGLFIIKNLTDGLLYDFTLKHIAWYAGLGIVYYSLFALIFYLMIYNHNLKERKKNEDRLLAMVKEAELNLLKSQINPHFLFNSLNSISSLTITNPSKAQEMIIKLSDFLRYSISRNNNQKSTLKLELENLQRYLDIEKTRFGNKLNYSPDISDDCMDKTLPVMILQPLYENAIKHGVYESTEPITLTAVGRMENGFLTITLINNFDPESPSKKGEGIGLKNIKERLRLTYFSEGLLHIKKTENTFEVKLIIPQ
jgi:sensor histidine kinase YesM